MDTGMTGHPRGGAGRAPALALALALLAFLPAAATAGQGGPAAVKAEASPARKDVAVAEARLQRSRERLDALSRALQGAVGDQTEYARLRALHDREVDEYDTASRALQAVPSPY